MRRSPNCRTSGKPTAWTKRVQEQEETKRVLEAETTKRIQETEQTKREEEQTRRALFALLEHHPVHDHFALVDGLERATKRARPDDSARPRTDAPAPSVDEATTPVVAEEPQANDGASDRNAVRRRIDEKARVARERQRVAVERRRQAEQVRPVAGGGQPRAITSGPRRTARGNGGAKTSPVPSPSCSDSSASRPS